MNHVDNSFKSPNVLSLCTGMRGLERGIERVIGSVNTIAYAEIEAFIVENLVKQMEQGVLAPTPVFTNLKTFPWRLFRGKIHGITGGYPCQPFSVAGQQKGTEDPRHLWPFIKEGIRAIEPVWCFFENVPGHINIGYRKVRSDLEQLGYRVKEGIFSAEEVGAPHQRKRLFILAIKSDVVGVDHDIRFSRKERVDKWSKPNKKRDEIRNSPLSTSQTNKSSIEKLADTRHTEPSGWFCGEKRQQHECWRQSRSVITSQSINDMANSEHERLQGWLSNGKNTEGKSIDRYIGCSSTSVQDWWPARPREKQYKREHKRTVEPRLGFTINGYNFREDLLRMAGNGVVEQTAELAFNTLLNKHLLHNDQ